MYVYASETITAKRVNIPITPKSFLLPVCNPSSQSQPTILTPQRTIDLLLITID